MQNKGDKKGQISFVPIVTPGWRFRRYASMLLRICRVSARGGGVALLPYLI